MIEILIAVMGGATMALISVFIGAWIMYKGQNIQPGQSFIGKPDGGDAFSVPFPDDNPDYPVDVNEQKVASRATEFLKNIGKV